MVGLHEETVVVEREQTYMFLWLAFIDETAPFAGPSERAKRCDGASSESRARLRRPPRRQLSAVSTEGIRVRAMREERRHLPVRGR